MWMIVCSDIFLSANLKSDYLLEQECYTIFRQNYIIEERECQDLLKLNE